MTKKPQGGSPLRKIEVAPLTRPPPFILSSTEFYRMIAMGWFPQRWMALKHRIAAVSAWIFMRTGPEYAAFVSDPPPDKSPLSGFPLPPPVTDADGVAHWKNQLDHVKVDLDYKKISAERSKLQIEKARFDQLWFIESAKAAVEHAKAAINQAMLINGGAAAALLAYIGSSAGREGTRIPIAMLVPPLECFALGLVAAAGTSALSYLSQMAFTHGIVRVGGFLRFWAVASWISSVVLFVTGVFWAGKALGTFGQ